MIYLNQPRLRSLYDQLRRLPVYLAGQVKRMTEFVGFAVVIHAGSIGWRLGKVSRCLCDFYREMCTRERPLLTRSGRSRAMTNSLHSACPEKREFPVMAKTAWWRSLVESRSSIAPCTITSSRKRSTPSSVAASSRKCCDDLRRVIGPS